MILSTVAGSRPETMAKFMIDILMTILNLIARTIPEYLKFVVSLVEVILNSGISLTQSHPEKKSPFPKKPIPKVNNKI